MVKVLGQDLLCKYLLWSPALKVLHCCCVETVHLLLVSAALLFPSGVYVGRKKAVDSVNQLSEV